jgi:hypothetical protein
MMNNLFSRSVIGLGAVVASCGMLPVGAASANTSPSRACPDEVFTQPLLAFGDSRFYTLAPGESAGDFDGTGWTLSGGASIVTTTLADGSAGSVLDLPAGSSAVSPPMCVSTGYQAGRMMTRVVAPPPGHQRLSPPKVRFSTTTLAGKGPNRHMRVPGRADWHLTHKMPVAPGNPGTETVNFKFTAAPGSSEMQVYNLYVDPRMWR